MFDKVLQEIKPPHEMSIEDMLEKIFEDTQKLLEKTLKEFDDFNKNLYA